MDAVLSFGVDSWDRCGRVWVLGKNFGVQVVLDTVKIWIRVVVWIRLSSLSSSCSYEDMTMKNVTSTVFGRLTGFYLYI